MITTTLSILSNNNSCSRLIDMSQWFKNWGRRCRDINKTHMWKKKIQREDVNVNRVRKLLKKEKECQFLLTMVLLPISSHLLSKTLLSSSNGISVP